MDGLPANATDLFVIAVILISALIALARGLVHEVLSMIGWLGAIIITMYSFGPLSPYVRNYIGTKWISDAVTGIAIFVIALFLLSIASRRISKVVQGSALNVLDRSLGFVFGLARGAVLICLVFMVFDFFYEKKEERPQWLLEARTLPLMEQGSIWIAGLVPEAIRERTRSLGGDEENRAESRKESERLLERLMSPAPKGAATNDGTGYKKQERRDMDRLLQSNQ